MPTMGKYCKACPVGKLREFGGWSENTDNLRKVVETVDGKEIERSRVLTDEDYLFIQEDFTVTDGVFLYENVIYDDITPEWKQFCEQVIKFKTPFEERGEVNAVSNPDAEPGAQTARPIG
jgi:hypothetical protein